jgi:hypothetical protein
MKPSRSIRLPFEPAEHCYEEWYMAPNYAGDLYRKLEVSPAPYKYNVGEAFRPYDNSYCIDLETGKRAYITPTYCIGEEQDTIFIIIEEPYYDLVKTVYGDYVSRRFVTVRSKNTGKLYRTLCRELDYMDCEENLDVNNIEILENKNRTEEIKQAAQAYYPKGTLHEEKAVSAFIRGAKWADNSRPQSYSKQELRDMGFAFDLNGNIVDPKKVSDMTINYVLNRVINYLENVDTDDYMDSGIFQMSDLISEIKKLV